MAKECSVIGMGDDFLFCMEFANGSDVSLGTWTREKADVAISSLFITCCDLDGSNGNMKQKYDASVTVEATMILTVVLLCISILITQVYQLHDTITGTMILEETLFHLRTDDSELKKNAQAEAESYGEKLGNPRLWLGEYEIETKIGIETISGTARADDWEQEIVIKQFHPGDFLRKYEKILEIGEKLNDDGSGIQTGNESQLYGDSAGEEGS